MTSKLGAASCEKSHAFCIIPPANISIVLDEIRNRFDKASQKWPSHIRFAYVNPIIGNRNLKIRIEEEIALMPAFTITLSPPQCGTSTIGVTTKAKDGRVYITTECVAVWADPHLLKGTPQEYINNILGKHGLITNDEHIQSLHLSLAQMPNREEAILFLGILSEGWCLFQWTVTSFSLLEQLSQQYKATYVFDIAASLSCTDDIELNDVVPIWKRLAKKSMVYIETSEFERALQLSQHCTTIAPEKALPLFITGQALLGLGQQEVAREAFIDAQRTANTFGATSQLEHKIAHHLTKLT